jgi:hypothetical protein
MVMSVRSIIKEEILREEMYHMMKSQVTFTFDLHHDVGGHTNLRKNRHGNGSITDEDIIEVLEDANQEIIYNIIDGNIVDKRRFIVSQDDGDFLNVVILPEQKSPTKWNLVTITVMKKEDFKVSRGQLQIYV